MKTSRDQEPKAATPFPVLPIKVDTDKISRAHAASPLVESGKCFLPKEAPWLADFLYEMSVFPAGAHDNCVDSVTQFLNWPRKSNQNYGLLDYYKQVSEQRQAALAQQEAKQEPEAVAEEDLPRCPQCGSTFLQKLAWETRCGMSSFQFGAAVRWFIRGR